MTNLYLYLNIGTLVSIALLSFERRIHYVTQWRRAFWAIGVSAIPFIVWDGIFVYFNIWDFNPRYISGFYIGTLPVSEILFFVSAPFSLLFIYEFVLYHARRLTPFYAWIQSVGYMVMGGLALVLMASYWGRTYTVTVAVLTVITLVLVWKYSLQPCVVFISFGISLLPFLAFNSILTGGLMGLIPEPVVFYNAQHFSGIRLGSIPLEDVLFNFLLLVWPLLLYQRKDMQEIT